MRGAVTACWWRSRSFYLLVWIPIKVRFVIYWFQYLDVYFISISSVFIFGWQSYKLFTRYLHNVIYYDHYYEKNTRSNIKNKIMRGSGGNMGPYNIL
jgi:hypothetical protein